MLLKTIAHMKSDFPTKFGIPRQSNVVKDLKSSIIFTKEYRDSTALRGLEGYSYLWLLWGFSEVKQKNYSPSVRPPRLGGNTRMGVFATRSPYRPNPIGLSCVKIDRIELHTEQGPLIHVLGADLMDNTPIYDIKPYIPYADAHPEALAGFIGQISEKQLQVILESEWKSFLSEEQKNTLCDLLSHDPRPSYQNDPERVYGMPFMDLEIKFKVKEDILTVLSIEKA